MFAHTLRRASLALALITLATASHAATDERWAGLDALARGALSGSHVDQAVPGFELLVMQQGQTLFHQAYGDWTLGQSANIDSSSKTLSAAVLMSVTDSHPGQLTLDTALSALLPAFDTDDKRDITLRQAFSHTSGLPGSETDPVLYRNDLTLQQAAARIAQRPMSATPGSSFAYGGLSMQAAGAAVEVATGQSFSQLLAERITTPLGMTDTGFVLPAPGSANPRISGGLASTASDMALFMDMLLNDGVDRRDGDRVLSSAAVREMTTRQTRDDQGWTDAPVDNNRYGIGVWVNQLGDAGTPAVDVLAAGARGFHSWIDREHDLVLVFATDTTRFSSIETLSTLMHAELLGVLAVPEPGSAWLLGAGGALLLVLRRPRR